MLLSKLTRFPWKHNKTKIMAETAMTEEPSTTQAPEQPETVPIAPLELHPCSICARTFLPQPLRKHYTTCQKNATRKRKVFNSLKQRVVGTDLEPFYQRSILSKPETVELKAATCGVTPAAVRRRMISDGGRGDVLAVKVKPSRWKEKHEELMNTIRAAKENVSVSSIGLTVAQKSSVLSMSSGHERCPSCDRAFGLKAFDRHVEWCKEHKSRVQRSPACDQVAKDRLDARIKYRVPPLNKAKRLTIKDKYSSPNPGNASSKTPDTPTADQPPPLMTKSTTSLETIRTNKHHQQLLHRSPTAAASTTTLHSRSSFRLKDVTAKVVCGQRAGASGDRYQTTPVVGRRPVVHEAVVKGTPLKEPLKLNLPEVNSSDIIVSSLHVDFFKTVPKSKTMITWKDTLKSSTSNESTNTIMTSRRRANKKNTKGTNIPSRTNISLHKPIVFDAVDLAKMQKEIVTEELLAEYPPNALFKPNVEEIPMINFDLVEKLVPEDGPKPQLPAKFIVDNLLNAKNFSRLDAFLDDSASALSNTKRHFAQPNLVRDLSPVRLRPDSDDVTSQKSKLEIKDHISKNLTNQFGLQRSRRETEMSKILQTNEEEPALRKSTAGQESLFLELDDSPIIVRFEDTLRAFSPRPKLAHSPVKDTKNFVQSNIEMVKGIARKSTKIKSLRTSCRLKSTNQKSKLNRTIISASPIAEPRSKSPGVKSAINETIETNLKSETAGTSEPDRSLDILEYIMQSGVHCSDFILFNAEKTTVAEAKKTVTEATQYSTTYVLAEDKLEGVVEIPKRNSAKKSKKPKSIFTLPTDAANICDDNEVRVLYQRTSRLEDVVISCDMDSLESKSPRGEPDHTEIEEIFCSTNRSNIDFESITGLVSNAYSEALSKARVKQGIRKCNSEIYVMDNLHQFSVDLEKGSVDQCNVGQLLEPKYDLARQDEILALAGEQFLQLVESETAEGLYYSPPQTDVVLNNPLVEMSFVRTNTLLADVIPEKRRKIETPSVMKVNLQNNLKHIKQKKRSQSRFSRNSTVDFSKSSLSCSLSPVESHPCCLPIPRHHPATDEFQINAAANDDDVIFNIREQEEMLRHLMKELCKSPVESTRPQSVVSCFSCVSESVSPRFAEVIKTLDRPKKNYTRALEKIYEKSDDKFITVSEKHLLKLSHFSKKALKGTSQCTKLPKIESSNEVYQIKEEKQTRLDNVCSKFELPSINEEKKRRNMVDLDEKMQRSNCNFPGISRKPKQAQLSKSPSPTPDVTYNPFLTAERQLMDLLDDDFHPFKSSDIIQNTKRPHTTANTPKPTKKLINNNKLVTQSASTTKKPRHSEKKSIKNAENKSISNDSSNRSSSRASVVEPTLNFDQMDDFEFIENYINNAFDIESNSSLITDDDKCNKNYLASDYKYSDDSSIDPRLINENDNLEYPGSFTPNTLTPPLSDTETISSYKKPMLEPLVLARTEYAHDDDDDNDVDLDALLRDIDTLGKRFPKSKFSATPKDDLCSVSLHSSLVNSSSDTTERMKKLSSLKRSISLLDPVMSKVKPLKSKQDVDEFFMEQQQKHLMAMKQQEDDYQKQVEPSSLEKKDELFSVDDELYEEYKQYEQMYLQEKEEKRLNTLAYANEEDLSSKKSSDSAYGRKPSKARSSRHAKLTPLEPLPYIQPHLNRIDSVNSSGSDNTTSQQQPVPIPPTNVSKVTTSPTNKSRSVSPPMKLRQLSPKKQQLQTEKLSKFCHECGNKYPLNSAKFCVECGIKRLIL